MQADSSQKGQDHCLVLAFFWTHWSFRTRLCHDAMADCWKVYSKQVLYIQWRDGYMNHCSAVFQVNRFTVFSQGNPSLTRVSGEPQWHPNCECVCFVQLQSVISCLTETHIICHKWLCSHRIVGVFGWNLATEKQTHGCILSLYAI